VDNLNHAIRLLTPVGTQAVLTVQSPHAGEFAAGQDGTYRLGVSKAAGAGATSGTVTVTDVLPDILMLVSMAGSGWNCDGNRCTRGDTLSGGEKYPPITVTVNVSATAPAQATNQVTVGGGGAAITGSQDLTLIVQPPL